MNHTDPMRLFREAQTAASRGQGRECDVFKTIAVVSMGLVALHTASQILHQLWNDINRKEKGRGR